MSKRRSIIIFLKDQSTKLPTDKQETTLNRWRYSLLKKTGEKEQVHKPTFTEKRVNKYIILSTKYNPQNITATRDKVTFQQENAYPKHSISMKGLEGKKKNQPTMETAKKIV